MAWGRGHSGVDMLPALDQHWALSTTLLLQIDQLRGACSRVFVSVQFLVRGHSRGFVGVIWCPLPSNTQIIQSGALNANSVDVVSQLAVVRRRDVHSVEDCCAKAGSNNREPSSGPCRSQGAGEVGNATHCHRFQSRYYYYCKCNDAPLVSPTIQIVR